MLKLTLMSNGRVTLLQSKGADDSWDFGLLELTPTVGSKSHLFGFWVFHLHDLANDE